MAALVCRGVYPVAHVIQPLARKRRAPLRAEVVRGLDYLHSQCIVHRDLKPEAPERGAGYCDLSRMWASLSTGHVLTTDAVCLLQPGLPRKMLSVYCSHLPRSTVVSRWHRK